MMDLWKSMAGMVDVELTSADVGSALAAISVREIKIWEVSSRGDLTVQLRIYRRDYRKLLVLTKKRGETLKLLRRQGLYWGAKSMLCRPVLMGGLLLLMIMVFFLPTRVFFVQVEGNESIPENQILEAAAESGIRFGASRREVRSEKVKNLLLAELPGLQWAGVNTHGCVAVISVRERSLAYEEEEDGGVASIVADRDGIILSCTATKGNLLCAPGQAVQAGDVLISGFTDCGLTITATRAEGEIIARTRRDLTVFTPSQYRIRGEKTAETTKYSLLVGKKRINFYKGSGIWDATCGKMYTEYHLTLPGGFQLPVTLVKESFVFYDTNQHEAGLDEAAEQLSGFAADYLRRIMIGGSVISGDTAVETLEGLYCLTGEFSCTEMIGRVRGEQIGE